MSISFFEVLKNEKPLSVAGAINPYSALLAKKTGIKALYISGAGVANASFGLPDLALTSLDNVLEDLRRIRGISNLPILVDCDTGWGSALNISKTTKEMISAGASGIHIEDQVSEKRCGHRPNKEIVSTEEMCDRMKAARDAITDDEFMLMARTDAFANEGINGTIERAQRYVEAGANALFPEAITSLEDYKTLSDTVSVPILANITEFGMTPLFKKDELKKAGISIILHPLSAFRAMSKAALEVYSTISEDGNVEKILEKMQSRDELYEILDYHTYEKKIDDLFSKE
ncbi:MAG: 2-methylisocitrate lyase [Gammaproteobacteria bacterium]|nr:MAG: 2-methylisocitrate lyase [Gammaproteobacteria bacterium]